MRERAVTVLTELELSAAVAPFDNNDLQRAIALLYETTRLLSLDDHYRSVRPLHGSAFTLLPYDTEAPAEPT